MDPNPAAAGASYPKSGSLTKKQEYSRLWGQLDQEYSSFRSHYQELNDYIMPRRARFTLTDRNRGERRNSKIIDSTATMAARTLSSGMMSGITSPARPWFRLSTPDPDLSEHAAVKDWLHTVTSRMRAAFVKSNWYNVLPNLYYDLGIFATGAMMIEEDDEQVFRCTSFPIGTYRLANDDKGRARVFMREFGMTVRQIYEKFVPDENDQAHISTVVRDHWKQNRKEIWIDVVHVIQPNANADITKLESRYKPFIECYFEKGQTDGGMLRESGFDEFPILAARWATTGEDSYGTDSPGITALGDIKQLQLGEKKGMQAIEKMINPAMVAPPGMRNFKLSLLPGDVSYVSESQYQSFRPAHEVKPQIQDLEYKQEQVRARIRRAFYEDLFLMLAYSDSQRGKQPVTAAEISERHDEKLLALGPVLEQLNQDVLDPAIDRVFAIMVRKGLIPEPPQEIEGQTLKVEYISIMAQAQKMVGLSGLERFSMFVGTLAQQQAGSADSPVWDKYDIDQGIDEYADMMGVPPRVVVPDEDVAAIREGRAKAAQAAQAATMAESVAGTAKTMSETDTERPSALSELLAGAA